MNQAVEKQWFQACLKNKELVERLSNIQLIITDVDGCLTDNTVIYSSDSEVSKAFSVQDGFIITKCNKPNMPHLALITGRSDVAVAKRAKKLGIPDDLYLHGYGQDKSSAVTALQKMLNISTSQTIYFGDDFLDLAVAYMADVFASPKNALFYIKENADIIIPRPGGHGAFRLLLDLLLYIQKKHFAQQYIEDALQN